MEPSPILRLRDILRRLRCLIACCGATLIIENSQIDGEQNEEEEL